MGVGKTVLGLKHADTLYQPGRKFLVTGPKKKVFDVWKAEAQKFGFDHLIDSLEFTTYRSLPKQDPNKYHAVYLDECHNLLDSHRFWLDMYPGKILGMTGTVPKESNYEKYNMVQDFCPIVYQYGIDDAVDDGILNDYRIVVHYIPLTDLEYMIKTKKKSFSTTERKSYNYWTDKIRNLKHDIDHGYGSSETFNDIKISRIMRMKAMHAFPSKEKYTKLLLNSIQDKCIVFCNTQEQADKICKHSFHSGNTSSEDNLAKFNAGTIMDLSCVLQLNEGANIKELRQGIIMHAYSNEVKLPQRLGRLLRLNPDDTATAHILCQENTIDQEWVNKALQTFNPDKIRRVRVKSILNKL